MHIKLKINLHETEVTSAIVFDKHKVIKGSNTQIVKFSNSYNIYKLQ